MRLTAGATQMYGVRESQIQRTDEAQSSYLLRPSRRQSEEPSRDVGLDILPSVCARAGNDSTAALHATMLNASRASHSTGVGGSLLRLQRQYGNHYLQRVVTLARQEGETEVPAQDSGGPVAAMLRKCAQPGSTGSDEDCSEYAALSKHASGAPGQTKCGELLRVPLGSLQRAIGNRAVGRLLRSELASEATPVELRRKCACGGECADCRARRRVPELHFDRDHEEGTEARNQSFGDHLPADELIHTTQQTGSEPGQIRRQPLGAPEAVPAAADAGVPPPPGCTASPAVPFDANKATIHGPMAASNALGACDWGLTFPEAVRATISARCDGTKWVAVLTGLTGDFSQQVRLLPSEHEVGGNTTHANFCDQATELHELGHCPGKWYKLAAVKAHEDVHLTRFNPALIAKAPAIEATITALSVPDAPGKTAAQAATEIKALPGFAAALTTAQTTWLAEVLARVAHDHDAGGPCETAEHGVVDPVVNTICGQAKANGWGACAVCP